MTYYITQDLSRTTSIQSDYSVTIYSSSSLVIYVSSAGKLLRLPLFGPFDSVLGIKMVLSPRFLPLNAFTRCGQYAPQNTDFIMTQSDTVEQSA